jgi:hypothetical protein
MGWSLPPGSPKFATGWNVALSCRRPTRGGNTISRRSWRFFEPGFRVFAAVDPMRAASEREILLRLRCSHYDAQRFPVGNSGIRWMTQ